MPTNPALILLSGNAANAAFLLARNLIAARLIGVENYGIAASFAIVNASVELTTNLGLPQFLIQNPKGGRRDFQAALHLVMLVRGVICGLAILLLAPALAAFLNVAELTWAYQTLALVPLLLGLTHLDSVRFQRHRRHAVAMMVHAVPPGLALLTLYPLIVAFEDFRAVLLAALIQSLGSMLLSHGLARRSYSIRLNPVLLRRCAAFGWPLALNGLGLFAVFHGEKLITGNVLGLEQLAVLAMGFTLTLTPALVLARSLQSHNLPLLARQKGVGLSRAANQTLRLSLLASAGLMIGLMGLKWVIPWLLGPSFIQLIALLPILAVLHGLRVIKAGISCIALSQRATGNALIGNVPRIVMLPFIWVAARHGSGLFEILSLALLAEFIGALIAFLLLKVRLAVDLRQNSHIAALTALVATAVLSDQTIPGLLIFAGLAWVAAPKLRRQKLVHI